jgi:NAD(P)-dependent dehydrogenase (short-subunit alcohol dehydrogenase family)
MNNRPFPADRTAIVTGGGSPRGIGRALCHRLARGGWSVAVLDINGEAANAVAEQVTVDYGVPAIGVATDIADETAIADAVAVVERTLPPVVGLANVAGVSSPTPFLQVTTEEWDRVFDVNIRGQFFVIRRVLPGLVSRGIGRIVNVSSASAQRGGGTYSKVPYSASKAAVLGLTRALAREVGRDGVTVNAVSPGPIDTDIMGGTLTDERRAALVRDLVVDRLGTVDDVAAIIEFLLGEDAGYISGATYNVNGGLIID